MSTALLQVDGLSITSADGRRLVSDVSFALEAGQTLGIVGESGSGKSLTCRAVLGMLPAGLRISAGSIFWRGAELLGSSPARYRQLRREEIGAVFQDPGSYLNPSSRIGAQLRECLHVRAGLRGRQAQATAGALLDAVGIHDAAAVLRRFPHELSGGMQQRVLIAMALCGHPALLIADEVTTALDVVVQHQVVSLLARHKTERGLAMLMVSHDLALVSQVCDDILVMKDGRVVEQGRRVNLLAEPRHAYTRLLIDTHLRYGLDAYV